MTINSIKSTRHDDSIASTPNAENINIQQGGNDTFIATKGNDIIPFQVSGQAEAPALEAPRPPEVDASPDVALKIADARSKRGDFRSAAESLADAILQNPGDVRLIEQCARYRLLHGDAAAAVILLEPLEEGATPAQAITLARARAVTQGPDQAAATLARASETHPRNQNLVRERAEFLMKGGNAGQALELLEPYSRDPNPAMALMLARARMRTDNDAGAETVLGQSLELNPGHRRLILELARLRLARGDAAGALDTLAALEVADLPAACLLAAEAHAQRGDAKLAHAALEQSLARHADDPRLIRECARYRLRSGDAAGALALLAPLEPVAEPGVMFLLADAKSKLEGAESAAAVLAQALERYPENLNLAETCARYCLESGDARGAVAVLAPRADVLPASGLVRLVGAMLEIGDGGAAEAALVRALDRFPGEPALTGQLAGLCLDSGRSREAVALLSQIEEIAPPAKLLLLAKARLFVGDVAHAEATLMRAVERNPDDGALLEGLAKARLSAGRPNEALVLLDRVPEPRGTMWYKARARAHEMLGNLAGFEAAIRQGLTAFPDDLMLLSDLSKTLSAQGRLDEGRVVSAAIEDAAITNPKNLAGFVVSHFIFGETRDAADLVARIVAKLESAPMGRASATALIQLIPAARLLLPEIGIPIVRRLLVRLSRETVALSVDQQIAVATASAAVGDGPLTQQRVSALTAHVERPKDIIEAMSLAAWANDEATVARLCDLLRAVPDSERGGIGPERGPFHDVRIFSDPDLGALGFDVGGTDVAVLFPGFYDTPSVAQAKLVQGLIARGIDVIRLFDMRRDVFLSGIGPAAGDRAQSADALKRLISRRGYRRAICAGTSGGGMPAALYGDAIGAERVVVFSTGTFFPPDDDPLERRARGFMERVRKLRLDEGTDNLEIWRRPGVHPQFEIHFATGNPQDARHALRMAAAANVALHPVETASHNFFLMWSADAFGAAIAGVA